MDVKVAKKVREMPEEEQVGLMLDIAGRLGYVCIEGYDCDFDDSFTEGDEEISIWHVHKVIR